jgi:hypothetical protein
MFGVLLQGPAAGAEDPPPLGQITPYLRITGELRGRLELNNFFEPSPALNNNNDYVFGEARAWLGVGLTTRWIDALVQGEYSGVWGLPDDAIAAPGGALGTGALYFAEHPESSQNDAHLKQLYLTAKPALLHVPGLFLTLGRFEIRDGLEYRTGDAKFDFLKTARISQRLIGPFDFANASRNFDGVRGVYDSDVLNITVSATHPTQGGFNVDAQPTMNGVDVVYAAVTGKRGALLPGTEARFFYLYYGDDRTVQVVDNRPAAARPFVNVENLAIHNVGAHILMTHAIGPGIADALAWGDYQFGEWTDLDHEAWAVALEAGYQFTALPLAPWIRAGYFQGSGDDDPGDRRHGTFFNVLPTARIYANFPFYNMMNVRDSFAQLILAPTATTRLRLDYHNLALSESQDLFYSGSGAQNRSKSFGYVGRASNGASSLADVVEAGFSHAVNQYFSWNAYYGHAFGGEVMSRFFRGQDDADYGFLEFTAKF